MADSQLALWCDALAIWAASKHEISELWIFGSRARGDHRNDSDLDAAVILSYAHEGESLGVWMFEQENWCRELAALIPIKIDLQIGDKDNAGDIVAPAVKKDGKQIYPRQ
jgi:predicted nucleotidyltransferase